MRHRSASGHRHKRTGTARTRIGIAALLATTCLGTLATSFTAAEAAPVAAAPAAAAPSARLRENDPMAALALEAVADIRAYMAEPAGSSAMLGAYEAVRAQIATELANRLAIDPARMIAA